MMKQFSLIVTTVLAMAFGLQAQAAEIIIGTNGKPGNPRVTGAEMFGALLAQSSKANIQSRWRIQRRLVMTGRC